MKESYIVDYNIDRDCDNFVFARMIIWLSRLGDDNWYPVKVSNDRITGIGFYSEDDAIAFKLKFGK